MRFLADDLLEGRETGTRGYDIGAEYVAAQFAAAGLKPIAGTWFEPIAFRSAKVREQSMTINGEALVARKDFVLSPNMLRESVDLTAPVVLAGFGVVAPELHHDDYQMIDARGKIVLIVTGAPPAFPTDQRAYYSSTLVKTRTAAQHGAKGILFVPSNTDEKRSPFEKRAQQEALPSMRYLDGTGHPADALETIEVIGRVSQEAANRLLEGARVDGTTMLRDAEQSTTYSLDLKPTVALHVASDLGEASSANVVGVLRGSDPKLRDEYVIVSAHLDHLGNHPQPSGGDSIFNGAYDNGSGIACLIEIARALVPQPPKRSVVFVAFTGEEKGEQGSNFFARNPPVPKTAIVADVNMDMFLMLYPVRDLVALGGEHSTLGRLVQRAVTEEHLELSPDPLPEEVRFIRSDQFAFVEEGIPAIHLKGGNKSADPSVDGGAVTRDWLRRIYHSRADDMSQHFDFPSGAKYAETNLRLVRAIADAPQRPRWNRSDFFASKR